ncbi:MAG: GH3 auxin-responsive promoter family protein, partial [Planctomycetota bacterium]
RLYSRPRRKEQQDVRCLQRTLLKPVARLAAMQVSGQVRRWLASHQRTAEVQQQVLRELLARHADSDFGREHGLDRIRTYEEFTRAVPVRSYEQLRPWVRRVFHGEPRALLGPGEKVLMFSQTSGSTGEPKNIPVTQGFLADMRRGWNIFGYQALMQHRDAWLRPILQISSPMQETTSPTGLPCGAISGLLAETQKRIVRRMYPVPRDVFSVADAESKYYTILRCGIGQDVAFITTANPSSTLRLIEIGRQHIHQLIRDVADGTCTPPAELPEEVSRRLRFRPNFPLARRIEKGLRRDGQFRPEHVWRPTFLANWTGGTLQLYVERLREWFPGVPVRDIGLLASEGRFSIPLADDTPGGVAEILGNFLEFIPTEHADDDAPPTLRAHELEVGGEYVLVFSNATGLWRYNLGDRVRVTGHFHDSPVFEFLCRGAHTSSITGEKITEHQVVQAMRQATAELDSGVERFELQGRFAEPPYYELRIESRSDLSADALASALDRALARQNIEYASKRNSGRLGPVSPALLPSGEFARREAQHIAKRRGRGEQYKHQYLLTEVLRPVAR